MPGTMKKKPMMKKRSAAAGAMKKRKPMKKRVSKRAMTKAGY